MNTAPVPRPAPPHGDANSGARSSLPVGQALALFCALGSMLLFSNSALEAAPLRGNLGIHDPSTIIRCKERYYLFGTGQGILSKWSTDKVLWNAGPAVFASPPAWTTNAVPGFTGLFWAPDVIYLNGQYRLYYAVSTWGSQLSAIGLVTNPTLDPADPAYRWTDRGVVIQSYDRSVYNTIDPSIALDAAGNPWMSFGSYWNGIYVVQLDPQTGLRLAPNSPTYRVAYNSSIEASCLFRRGGYYYLFANWGSCCSGINSTYNIRVGRSTSVTGPYLDRNGVDMAANGGTLFLQGTGKFTGPGHVGILSEDGAQWFSYHYYDAGAWAPWYGAFGVADFDFEPLSWTADDWPVFTNDWSAVYRFANDAWDEGGQYYGLLIGNPAIQTDPLHGRVLNLNGTNQYVQLPPGIAYARTYTAVVKWNGGPAWQRLINLGRDTSRYFLLTPSSSSGRLRCELRANGLIQTLEAPSALPVGAWAHVAVTLDGTRGVLYLNGSAMATNASMSLSPLDVQAETNYLGHSLFASNPDFNGQLASFRAYGRALSQAEIVAPLPTIDQPAEGTLYWPGSEIAFSGRTTDFAEVPLSPAALTWRVDYLQDGRTNLVWGPVTGTSNGLFVVPTNATGGGSYRVSLIASGGPGRQRTVSVTLRPANPTAGWNSYYPLTADAQDAAGHFDGVLNGGAAFSSDPVRGSTLNLPGTTQFVKLPAGAASLQTFMAWVKWNGGGAWQRIFDFGNDTNRYTVLTPAAANGKLRLNISLNGIAGESVLDGPDALPVGVWTHVAVTMDGHTAILYTNGVAVATNANFDLVPGNLGATNNYLGKSQWPDPYFNGQLSSVPLFSRALTSSEIVAPQVVINQPAHGSLYAPGDSIRFAGGANDFYDQAIAATGLTWTVQFRNGSSVIPLYDSVSGLTEGTFSIPLTGPAASNGFYRILLTATDDFGRKATNTVDIFPVSSRAANPGWASYYPFTTGAADASNRFNGTLFNGASIQADPVRGPVLNLAGGSQYVGLPAGSAGAQTVAGWVRWNGGAAWQRLFDFGQDTSHWFMLTPLDGDGKMECALSTDRPNYVQSIQAGTALPAGVWTHVAAVFDGRQGILYTNGVVAGINNSVNLLPSDVAATKCYLGRSQYSADAYFSGKIDALELNSRPLTPEEVWSSFVTGFAAPSLTLNGAVDRVVLSWPTGAGAMRLYSAPDLAEPAQWTPVTDPMTVSNGMQRLTMPATNGSRFFRLGL